ncbi:MAG: nitrilase-related carbon-nitrogen hydrolase [Polyangiales bacterium]
MSDLTSLRLAVVQCALAGARQDNHTRLEGHLRAAAGAGAQVVLLPELFDGPYFPQWEDEGSFALAAPLADAAAVQRFCALASELGVVLPISFFERAGPHHYNSVAMVDADGDVLGVYRKAHIPAGPGYQEKFFFRPGDTGFRVWQTQMGPIGVGICWDQWFPEAARAMMLQGAELLLYPTAIGSEPQDPTLDTRSAWQRAMQGHAVCNAVPIAAANRCGREGDIHFYGHSFICDGSGEFLVQMDAEQEGFVVVEIDLAAHRRQRAAFGFFRDRRPDLYGLLSQADAVPAACRTAG